MNWPRPAVLAAALLMLLAAGPARATQCDVTATPLGFGPYDPLDPVPLAATATLEIRCKPARETFLVRVQLSAGNGSIAQRRMTSAGGSDLLYNICLDPACTTLFGDGTGGSAAPAREVTRAVPWSLTLYGRIPALQNVVPGVYSDVLTATILY